MAEFDHESRSTIILIIAILIAVLITVWLILSFSKPDRRDQSGKETGLDRSKIYLQELNSSKS